MRAKAIIGIASALAGCVALTAGCAVAPRTPVLPYYGTLFNNTTAPVDITFDKTRIGDRTGRSSAVCVLGLFSFGDCSVHSAAANGNIQTVDHIDCAVTNVLLGVYSRYETIVYGRPGP